MRLEYFDCIIRGSDYNKNTDFNEYRYLDSCHCSYRGLTLVWLIGWRGGIRLFQHFYSEELGIEAIEPLWGQDPERVLLELIDAGFEATIASAKSDLFNDNWIGRKMGREFLSHLKDHNIDPCGENGEYHTFVTDGPMFNKKIKKIKSQLITRENHWFLDTLEYSLELAESYVEI